MAVAERQGREKPRKIEQRKVKGRSEDLSEALRQNRQHLASPVYMGQARGEDKAYKKRSQRARALSLARACTWVCVLLPVFRWACPHAWRMDSPAIF